jgi:hypothetical protein
VSGLNTKYVVVFATWFYRYVPVKVHFFIVHVMFVLIWFELPNFELRSCHIYIQMLTTVTLHYTYYTYFLNIRSLSLFGSKIISMQDTILT